MKILTWLYNISGKKKHLISNLHLNPLFYFFENLIALIFFPQISFIWDSHFKLKIFISRRRDKRGLNQQNRHQSNNKTYHSKSMESNEKIKKLHQWNSCLECGLELEKPNSNWGSELNWCLWGKKNIYIMYFKKLVKFQFEFDAN